MSSVAITAEGPRRTPLACGALGRADPAIVRRLAAAMPAPVGECHADDASILMLDREPVRWRTWRRRGLAWSESAASRLRARDWTDLAGAGSAAGLVLGRSGPMLHTSASGVAPLYYASHDGAVYFASRIDPLAQALPRRLSVDWDAWCSILCLKYPLGTHTPFAEIRRMPPSSTLVAGRRKGRLRREPWPWAEVEPTLGVEEGAAAIAEALRSGLARLRGESVVCPLSGGLDSRVVAAGLAEVGPRELTTLTAAGDRRTEREETIAAIVAERLGVPHETCAGRPDSYWDDVRRRALRCDYQLAADPWMMPLADRLAGSGAVVADGLALDALAFIGRRFYTESMIHPDGGRWLADALWKVLGGDHSERTIGMLLSGRLARAVRQRAHHEFVRRTHRWRGHPAEPVLLHYLTRTLRGVSLNPSSVLGADARIITPFCDEAVAAACLAIRPEAKFGSRLYDLIVERLTGSAAGLEADFEPPTEPRPVRPRRLDPSVAEGYLEVLGGGPLTPFLGRRLRRCLETGELTATLDVGGNRRLIDAVTLFHLWCERYSERLGTIDPAAGLATEDRVPAAG
jgi:hypothetical protein